MGNIDIMNRSRIDSSVWLSYGFRLFFLLAALWSMGTMATWMFILDGHWQATTFLTPALWHAHEMLFGFVSASAAGFLLTASPNWSKKPALTGIPLLLMLLFWIIGRLAVASAVWWPAGLVAVLDLLFPVALMIVIGSTLWYTGNPMHRIFPVLLGLIVISNGLVHSEAVGWTADTARMGLYLGIDAMVFFLVMVGGHVMPMFTRMALQADNLPPFKVIPLLEIAGAVTMVGVVLGDIFYLDQPIAAPFLIAAGLVQGVRLSQWHSLKSVHQPLLWVLHLGYGWLVMGLIVRGLAQMTLFIPPSAAMHALSVGAMGLFILGIISRISLVHTGRALLAHPAMTTAYSLVAAAALIRVFGVAWWPLWSLRLSGLLWVVAFGLLLVRILPVLLRPRPDGQPG